jgi:hypothetical protein
MPYITPRGDPKAPIWFILQAPYGSDIPKGILLSGGMGNVFDKMLKEAGISFSDCYFCCRAPNSDDTHAFSDIDGTLSNYHPPFIGVLGEVGAWFLPEELQERGRDNDDFSKGQLQKYAGSLLSCKKLSYPHYMMPLYGPDRCAADWAERNVTTYVDLQKLKGEFDYWKKHQKLMPLPERKLEYGDLDVQQILSHFDRFRNSNLLSIDIETVYPRQKSAFLPHPGYPITIGIADSSSFGISFKLFQDKPDDNRNLWRGLDNLITGKKLLGQNFFNFDALFFEALGFRIQLCQVQDTLVRHHILWPELSHKLQFMTRQYTREPYYKDEGHGWSIKNMSRLRRYNCLDVCVTFEIFEAQEAEFATRPHLKE